MAGAIGEKDKQMAQVIYIQFLSFIDNIYFIIEWQEEAVYWNFAHRAGQKMTKVTLEQVARYAHVSRGTVDRVVNKRGNVKPEVEERVKEAIQVLGYERNRIASALASGKRSKKICIMFRYPKSYYCNEKILKGIKKAESELHDFGIEVEKVIVDSANSAEYCEKIGKIVEKGICGLALNGPDSREMAELINRLAEQKIPVVTFNSDIPDSKRVCFVGEDLYRSGRIAGNIMARLIRKGEKILIGCGIPQFYAHQARVDGFLYELKCAGFTEKDWRLFQTNQESDTVYTYLKKYFKEEENIRGIYMSIEPNFICGKYLQQAKLKERPFVICHDIDPVTISYIQNGIFDFVIDQDVFIQGYQALLILRDIVCFGNWNYRNVFSSHIYNAACFRQDEQNIT